MFCSVDKGLVDGEEEFGDIGSLSTGRHCRSFPSRIVGTEDELSLGDGDEEVGDSGVLYDVIFGILGFLIVGVVMSQRRDR